MSTPDVLVLGAGPAGVMAALRAADLGASVRLVTSGRFGGMAANDGPVPVRTLAHAARLMREARQLGRYGVTVGAPVLDYPRLLARVAEVVREVGERSALRAQVDALGVEVIEDAGAVRFAGDHELETAAGERLAAGRVILCTGGVSRKLPVPGAELTVTHSDAWSLTAVPASMLVIGSGATGAQVASVFNAFGSKVTLFEAGPRILPTEEPEVSAAMAQAFRASGIEVVEDFGAVQTFEPAPGGVRMLYGREGVGRVAEGTLAVSAIGWSADTAALRLDLAGVATNDRGFIRVNERLQTSAPHVFAAGDVTGGLMLAPQALHAGFVAATNALGGDEVIATDEVSPIGSFTDPEYAQVGLREEAARRSHNSEAVSVGFDATTRAIVDGHAFGFCKLVVERGSFRILGCHIVGERAVEIAQIAAVAIAARMRVDDLARLPLSFPTYAGVLARAAALARRRLTRGGGIPRVDRSDVG